MDADINPITAVFGLHNTCPMYITVLVMRNSNFFFSNGCSNMLIIRYFLSCWNIPSAVTFLCLIQRWFLDLTIIGSFSYTSSKTWYSLVLYFDIENYCNQLKSTTLFHKSLQTCTFILGSKSHSHFQHQQQIEEAKDKAKKKKRRKKKIKQKNCQNQAFMITWEA